MHPWTNLLKIYLHQHSFHAKQKRVPRKVLLLFFVHLIICSFHDLRLRTRRTQSWFAVLFLLVFTLYQSVSEVQFIIFFETMCRFINTSALFLRDWIEIWLQPASIVSLKWPQEKLKSNRSRFAGRWIWTLLGGFNKLFRSDVDGDATSCLLCLESANGILKQHIRLIRDDNFAFVSITEERKVSAKDFYWRC